MNRLNEIRQGIKKKERLHQARLISIIQPNQRKYIRVVDNSKTVKFWQESTYLCESKPSILMLSRLAEYPQTETKGKSLSSYKLHVLLLFNDFIFFNKEQQSIARLGRVMRMGNVYQQSHLCRLVWSLNDSLSTCSVKLSNQPVQSPSGKHPNQSNKHQASSPELQALLSENHGTWILEKF